MGNIFSTGNYSENNVSTEEIMNNIHNLLNNNRSATYSPNNTIATEEFKNVRTNMEGGYPRRRRYLALESEVFNIAQQGGNRNFEQVDEFAEIRSYLQNKVNEQPIAEGSYPGQMSIGTTPATEQPADIANILNQIKLNLSNL